MSESVALLNQVIEMFETQIEHAPSDRKPLLTIYLQMYKDKVKKLQQDIKVANEPE